MTFPLPEHEEHRLEVLNDYKILDSNSEKPFDDIVFLAAQICEAPIALISLVDSNRQWFKAKIGVDISETPREVAFCSHTIMGNSVLLVPDTTKDSRFSENPFVVSGPKVRFYAGVPLSMPEGEAIGSLCVVDLKPRSLAPEKVAALEALSREVIARLQLRRQIYRSTQLNHTLKAVLDSSTQISIIATDLSGMITVFNAGAENLLGYTAAEILHKQTPQVIHLRSEIDSYGEVLSREFGRLIAGFDVFVEKARLKGHDTREWTYVRKDGTYLKVNLTVTSLRDAEGRMVGFLGIALDVTAQRQAEKLLADSYRELESRVQERTDELYKAGLRFQELADAMPQIVWTAQPNGMVDYYNKRWYEFTGFVPGGTGDQSWKPIIHPDDLQRCVEAWYTAIRSGHNYEIECRFKDRQTGGYRWFLARAVPTKDEQGRVLRWFGTSTDIDDKRRIEEHLEQRVYERTEELKRSQQTLMQTQKLEATGRLAAGVAHEINNPLAVILGFAESAARHVKDGDPLDMPLKSIKREALRCKQLVQNLLTFARSPGTDKHPTDLNAAVEAALTLVEARAGLGHITIEKKLASDLPCVLINANQIQQVVINLANNAIDAMGKEGNVTVQTEIVLENSVSWVTLSVTDTGPGIPHPVMEHIFEPFFTTKPVGQGTGLGLSLVYEIAQKHNSRVHVSSVPGKTEFRLRLPIADTAG